ncbi:MAG: TonB-dependent receptor [Phreatobacter sp.]
MAAAVMLSTGTAAIGAQADSRAATQAARFHFDIASKPLSQALAEFRAITGTTVSAPGLAIAHRTPALRGEMTAAAALASLTMGSGLSVRMTGARSAILVEAARPVEMQAAVDNADGAIALDTITVQGAAGNGGGVTGYLATRTSSATKTDTPLRDVPQSVSVVTRQFLDDTAARSIADATRYVPGVGVQYGEGNRDALVIRGQTTTADFFADGVRDDVQYYRDFYNIDRVEFLKGPNAMIFGRGGGGGVVNRVLNQADWQRHATISVMGGMFSDGRVQLDVGNAVNEAVAVRMNAMFEKSGSYRDFVDMRRYGINPQIAFRPNDQTTIKLAYEYFHDDRTADRGIPSYNGIPFPTARGTFFGNPQVNQVVANVHAATAIVEHETEGGIRIRNYTRFADYAKFYQNEVPGTVNAAGTQVSISAYNNQTQRQNFINQTDVNFRFNTGPLDHRLLVGAETGIQNTTSVRMTGYFNNVSTTVLVPTSFPIAFDPITFRPAATDANGRTSVRYAAAYVQDQIEITKQLQVIAGLRFDSFNINYLNNLNGQTLERRDDLLSPRLGVVFKPIEPVSLYASYSISYLPQSGDQFTSLTATTQTLKPEQFTNYEVGIKYELLRNLSVTAALYLLDRKNTTAPDPVTPGLIVQTGSTRTKGFEIGINGYLTDRWQVAGGYAYQDAYISSTTAAAVAGSRVPLVPRNTFSLWNKYQITDMWAAGIGVVHQTNIFAAIDNMVTLPAFTRVDAAIFVKINDMVKAQLNVENIFDVKYYPTASSNSNILPGAPRTVRLTLTGTF